jgi:hypothetical protein
VNEVSEVSELPSQSGVEIGARANALLERVTTFRDAHIYPNEQLFNEQSVRHGTQWKPVPILEELRRKAKAEGLWNLFLNDERNGAGLCNLDYAPATSGRPRSLIAIPPTPATWACWRRSVLRSSGSGGSSRCSKA